jgi:hypothetical protein
LSVKLLAALLAWQAALLALEPLLPQLHSLCSVQVLLAQQALLDAEPPELSDRPLPESQERRFRHWQ